MKNKIILFLSAITLLSCGTDLDQQPLVDLSTGNFFDAPDNLELSVIASYDFLQNAMHYEYAFGEIRSDNSTTILNEPPFSNFDNFVTDLKFDPQIDDYWDAHYKAILSNNIAINNLSIIEDSNQKNAIEGEAKFLRALSYFNLVRSFGDIPINTASQVAYDDFSILGRKPVTQVYELIVSDLQKASSVLASSNSEGRPTSYAAKSLLAKVYMTLGDFPSAVPLLKDVFDNSGKSIIPNYSDVFYTELNNEIIFAIQFETGGIDGQSFSDDFTRSGGEGVNNATQDLVDAYEAGDLRLGISINTGDSDLPNTKYTSDDPGSGSAGNDWPIIRFADVVLLYAEALNETGASSTTVLPLIDDIRTRAGLAILDPVTINSQSLVREAIKQERRIELAFENHRWFDLVRWGDAVSELGISNDFLVFPIPNSEVTSTSGNITQNTGY